MTALPERLGVTSAAVDREFTGDSAAPVVVAAVPTLRGINALPRHLHALTASKVETMRFAN